MKLVEIIKQGDEQAYRALYEKYYRRVYYFALKSVKNTVDAEDLSQSIFLKIWEKRTLLNESLPIEPQVFQIAKGVVIDYYRARTTQQQLLKKLYEQAPTNGSESDNTAIVVKNRRLEHLKKAIEELPAKRREVFKLSRYDGLTYDEIAEELAISKNTVRVHMTKALTTLRKKLAMWIV